MLCKNKIDVKDVIYNIYYNKKLKKRKNSVSVIGIDTEADVSGKCFMIATSLGDVFHHDVFPQCLFSRRYRNKTFVTYNLKYDEGAFLQFLNMKKLRVLWKTGKVLSGKYTIKSIPRKMLSVRRGKDCVTFYDMYNFFSNSLEYNAYIYLNEEKKDIDIKSFTSLYIMHYWDKIGKYCIQDAILVEKLAKILIKKFESFGVYPQKLFSTAFISFQYFRQNCNIVTVRKLWNEDKKVLQYSLRAYNGGKFEVTKKGIDYFYEYDIISAYPYEISNLIDISNARIIWSKKYMKTAVYSFLHCIIKIPYDVFSPVAITEKGCNIYPCGIIEKVITKKEYEYFVSQNCDITVLKACHFIVPKIRYPYRKIIENLMIYKNKYKVENKKLEYHIIKIFLNSFYGKLIQMIEIEEGVKCSLSWNPIYATVITANTRLCVTKLQNCYPSISAVHTDSIISTKKIGLKLKQGLGSWSFVIEGKGLILGSGIYQIGDKTKFRGFHMDMDLFSLMKYKTNKIKIPQVRVYTWKEVVFHNWEKNKINYFDNIERDLSVNFDKKRLWLDDYKTFAEVRDRNVDSMPYFVDNFSS